MKNTRSSRHLIKVWHRREKATIDHVAGIISAKTDNIKKIHSAFTSSGLSIEDQVRKSWHPPTVGLAMF